MRVVINELKKIFAVRYIIVTVIFAALFLPLYMREGLQIVGAYNYNAYLNEEAFSLDLSGHWSVNSRVDYRTLFGWFTDNFGYHIDDDDIAKMEQMTFPELDEYIASTYEFTYHNIHSTAELSAYLDECGQPEGYFSGRLFDENRGDSFREMSMQDAMQYSVNNLYYDRYIAENEFLRSNGITRYIDYDLMDAAEMDAASAAFQAGTDEESPVDRQLIRDANDELGKVRAKMREDSKNGTFVIVPEYETLHEQWEHFVTCYQLKRLYKSTHDDPLYFFDGFGGVYYTAGWTHTISTYRWDWTQNHDAEFDKLTPSERESLNIDDWDAVMYAARPASDAANIAKRVGELGDDYYYVRCEGIFNGWTGTGFGIIILSAVLCIIFAAPYAVADKRNIVPLQYTTKCGRKIERKKLWAVILMAVILSLIAAIAVLLIMPQDVCAQWFVLPLTSFSAHDLLWLDVNMWQYIALYIGISFLVNISTAVIAYTVCGLTGNIISAVCISVPLIIAELLLWTNPLSHIFSLPESAAETPVWCAGVAFAAVLGAVFITKRSRKPIL